MRLKQLSPEKIREFATYLDGHRGVLPFSAVIDGRTTLEKTVEDFYDIEDKSYIGRGPVETYEVRAEDISKKGKIPQDLLQFLSGFDNGSFDTENLVYERVRHDVEHFKRCDSLGSLSVYGGLTTSTVGIPIVGKALDLHSAPVLVFSCGISLAIFWYNLGYLGKRKNKPGKVAFVNLKKYSSSIDGFINDYRMLKEKQLL